MMTTRPRAAVRGREPGRGRRGSHGPDLVENKTLTFSLNSYPPSDGDGADHGSTPSYCLPSRLYSSSACAAAQPMLHSSTLKIAWIRTSSTPNRFSCSLFHCSFMPTSMPQIRITTSTSPSMAMSPAPPPPLHPLLPRTRNGQIPTKQLERLWICPLPTTNTRHSLPSSTCLAILPTR